MAYEITGRNRKKVIGLVMNEPPTLDQFSRIEEIAKQYGAAVNDEEGEGAIVRVRPKRLGYGFSIDLIAEQDNINMYTSAHVIAVDLQEELGLKPSLGHSVRKYASRGIAALSLRG